MTIEQVAIGVAVYFVVLFALTMGTGPKESGDKVGNRAWAVFVLLWPVTLVALVIALPLYTFAWVIVVLISGKGGGKPTWR